jgi:hypothetical protein
MKPEIHFEELLNLAVKDKSLELIFVTNLSPGLNCFAGKHFQMLTDDIKKQIIGKYQYDLMFWATRCTKKDVSNITVNFI